MPLTREELLTAVEENPEGAFELYGRNIPGARFHRDETMRIMCFGIPVPFFNGVAVARLTVEDCEERIAAAAKEMHETGMPWSWQVGPGSRPYDLGERLLSHGLIVSHEMPVMALDLGGWKPSVDPDSFDVLPVNDWNAFEEWSRVAQESFGLPKIVFDAIGKAQLAIGFGEDCQMRNFVGWAQGQAVSCGTVFYNHEIAGIYTIGTLPDQRGRGYGAAVTEACLADAISRGLDTAFLQSSSMGYRVYERIGFREICRIGVYVPADP